MLRREPEVLDRCERDYGGVVHLRPAAVVEPRSVEDVAAAVRSCRRDRVALAARGQGHSTSGQAQVAGGLVIDMASLHRIHRVSGGTALVDAGATWRELVTATLPLGWAPPVLTGYTGLSIGGTLSMGGIGAASFQHGAQVDHVLALSIVTGDGVLRTCSANENRELFDAVRGGIGQYGVIVSAEVRLVETAPNARYARVTYGDLGRFFADLFALTACGHADGIYGQVVPVGDAWSFVIHVVKFVSDDGDPLRGVALSSSAVEIDHMDRLAFDTLIDRMNAARAEAGVLELPRVWEDAFLPRSRIEAFVRERLERMTPAELGPSGFVLIFPIRNHHAEYALRLPREDQVFLFDVLTSGSPADPEYVPRQRTRARDTYVRARQQGGTLYPIGSTPMSYDDWSLHYGQLFGRLCELKHRYDPDHLLTPTPGVHRPLPRGKL